MNRFTYILDNGHGGIGPDGTYVTAPAKMFAHKGGPTIYEGLFNRQIVQKIAYQLQNLGIDFEILVPEADDVPLRERVARTNKIHKAKGGKTIFISVHGNAGKGTGHEVFTTKGQTSSDPVADIFVEELQKEFPSKKSRVDLTDGDLDKEANFTVLMCNGPAILTENFFMDTLEDAKLMVSDAGQTRVAMAHVEAIKRIEAEGIPEAKKKATKKKAASKKK